MTLDPAIDPLVDLNADLGEGMATEAGLLPLVSSANIACGGHAGDDASMRATVRAARALGVAVGAHPGYPDALGFGRDELGLSPEEIERFGREQVGRLAAICLEEGTRLRHVKPHGALYARVAQDPDAAEALARAVADLSPELILVGPPECELERAAAALWLRYAREGFADRAYHPDGSLVPRAQPGAVLADPAQAATRALALAQGAPVAALDGTPLRLDVATICLHGDTTGAVAIAARVRAALEAAGVLVRPLDDVLEQRRNR